MKAGKALLVLCAIATSAGASPPIILHVDCARAIGGDGRARAPFRTIGDAVSAARALALAGRERLVVQVRSGICSAETLPIDLDFPVWLRGSREAVYDDDGLPTGAQIDDTVVTAPPSRVPTVPPILRVTGAGVRVSHLSLDGQTPDPAPPAGRARHPGARRGGLRAPRPAHHAHRRRDQR